MILILGGARSGKSSHAQKLAEESGKSVTFIATAQAYDDEMKERIQKHREERPGEWRTLEIQKDISAYLIQNSLPNPQQTQTYLLDCITLLANNVFMQFIENDLVNESKAKLALENEINELIESTKNSGDEIVSLLETGSAYFSPASALVEIVN